VTPSAVNPLTVTDLSAGYPGRKVISGLTLPPIKAGEITALVGPNAAGKSTLLRSIAGLLPVMGSLQLGTNDLVRMTPRQRSALCALMPQLSPQRSTLTVLESVIASLQSGAPPKADISVLDRATAVLCKLGIESMAFDRTDRISGGQRQLASLAQALVREPDLLLLDEPTSALDLRHQIEVMKVATAAAREGRIVIAVLHDLGLAARWADSVIVLHKGEMHVAGTPKEAITPEMLAAVYGVRARVTQDIENVLNIAAIDTLGAAV
jgi:iron complex transport system ATP-binding protein